FRECVLMPSTHFFERAPADSRHCTAILRNQPQVHARLLVYLVAAGAFQIQQSREQFPSNIQGHHPAHNAANLGIKKWSHQLPYERPSGNVVGVKDEKDLGMNVGHGFLEGRSFSRFSGGAMERSDAPGIAGYEVIDDLARAIGGAVIDRNNRQFVQWIVNRQQRGKNVCYDGFLVVSSNQHGDFRPVASIDIYIRVALGADDSVQGEAVVPYRVDTYKHYQRAE